ncbi:FliM/FliN family flagellar motor switch protein [Tropicimonas sp. IMCC6043]|uniref:FliM/FliN family flagellar motor switch protein n=1 Tax=Tropicimonas sp. IMCC6043 TaxID=2510645 RepID=UPI00101D2931|nr:FliM/FliN family flagellar motor switch protein [Tropicimonas sp. IMCC6043]RYH12001.1 flagellar motor switch protein FliM [Tropicimonas sp. IMCC6043]
MAEAARQTIIRRKLDAGRDAAPEDRRVRPVRALSAALSKAAEDLMGLALDAGSGPEHIASLSDLLERLPENGLLAVLEGPRDGQGLFAFDSSALAAIIEKLTTGSVGTAPPSLRRPTRTDAALAADLIDGTLQRFETALAGREDFRWASGFGYSTHVEDIRPLGLLLEDIDYRIFGLTLDFELGRRQGRMLLALPAQGCAEIPPDAASGAPPDAPADPDWAPGLAARVLQGEVSLEAVLHRFQLPISAVGALRVGDEIPIPVSALDNLRFAGAEKIPLGRCRLGRSNGYRAVRLGAGGQAEAYTGHPGRTQPAPSAERPVPMKASADDDSDLPEHSDLPSGGGAGAGVAVDMAIDGLPALDGLPTLDNAGPTDSAVALDLDALDALPKLD